MVNLLITQNTSFVGIVSHYKEEGRRERNLKKKKVALNKTMNTMTKKLHRLLDI